MASAPRRDPDRSLSSAGRRIGRRTFLATTAATVLGVSACTDRSTNPPSAGSTVRSGTAATPSTPSPTASAAPPLTGAEVRRRDWSALDRKLLGRLLRPDDSGYRAAVRTFDPRRDSYRPLAVIRAADAGDIVDSLAFATDHGVSPRPRSGGHSYVGASTGNGVLVIDCAGLDTISYDAASRQVTVGAGVRLGDLHRVLDRHGRTVPTGTCPTIGAAGLTLGGGIGTETRLRGLTQDALVGATVVTPDGVTHTVSAGQEPDLLWALRGGGGGNLGIVTQFSYRTYPALSGEIFRLSWPAAAAADVLIGWQHRLAAMPTRSWANLHLDSSGGPVMPSITGIRWGGRAEDEIDALVDAVGRQPTSRRTWSETHAGSVRWFAGANSTLRRSWYAGSDVVGHSITRSVATAIVAAVGRWRGSGGVAAIFDPLGGAAGRPAADSTAFPWRGALADIQWYVGLGSTGKGNLRRAADWLIGCRRAIGGTSVGGYINYLEPNRPVRDYYGGNWDRLREINHRYDPHGVFDSRYSIPG
jgi:FAD/FMN-containing dehydrogenase